MFNLIPALLLLTSSYLIPMETLHIEPSNSSSEICFFINNIYHEIPQHPLIKDIKKSLLTTYLAVTNDERMASVRYNCLISSADYMHLQKNNKLTIQTLHTGYPITSSTSSTSKQLFLNNAPEAYSLYQKMLELPKDIRCKIAKEYSSMIFVKTKEKNHSIELLSTVVKQGILAPLGYLICGVPIFSLLMEMPLEATKIFEHKINEFEEYYNNGYDLLPLLPENDKK